MYQQNVYGYGSPDPESTQNSQQSYYSKQVNYARNIDPQEKPTFTLELLNGLTHSTINYNQNDDVEQMIHHTAVINNSGLPALPPLNIVTPTNRHREKWLSEQEKLGSANMMAPDPSILVQYPHDGDDRGLMSPYSPNQQGLPQQQEMFPSGDETAPYGCGLLGCYVTFPSSSALVYHIKTEHSNIDMKKPFRCAMPSCSKQYKNINGLQYHLRDAKGSSGHGASEQDANTKAFQCEVPGCKKAYRTHNGLRSHQQRGHTIQQPSMIDSSMHLPPHLMQSIQQQQQQHVMNQLHLQQQQQPFSPTQHRDNW